MVLAGKLEIKSRPVKSGDMSHFRVRSGVIAVLEVGKGLGLDYL